MTLNVFVMGLDDRNRATLQALPDAKEMSFHPLLTLEELQTADVSIPDVLEEAQRELDAFDGSIDAVVGYWDFPVSMLVPILCERYGLPGADLRAVVACEHKYWSRLEQQKLIEEVPGFGLLDLSQEHATLPPGVSYPVWIKPIKAASSRGARYVEDDDQLQEAVEHERAEVHEIGDAFDDILALVDLPPEVADVPGSAVIVEEAVTGRQVTVEGFSRDGQVEVLGVVDSIDYPELPSFLRYQYPSGLPADVQDRLVDVTRRVIAGIGLSHTTFNVEYFWDPDSGRLSLLEINARHSQSHAPLFRMVDGLPNHASMIHLALGRDPRLPRGEGPYAIAAKWYLRHFQDGVVHRVPRPQEIAALEQEVPGTTVEVAVEEGSRLSEALFEDSYTYVLAEIFIGARDEDELVHKYARCVEALQFQIEDQPEGA